MSLMAVNDPGEVLFSPPKTSYRGVSCMAIRTSWAVVMSSVQHPMLIHDGYFFEMAFRHILRGVNGYYISVGRPPHSKEILKKSKWKSGVTFL